MSVIVGGTVTFCTLLKTPDDDEGPGIGDAVVVDDVAGPALGPYDPEFAGVAELAAEVWKLPVLGLVDKLVGLVKEVIIAEAAAVDAGFREK